MTKHAIITGASSGLGRLIKAHLESTGNYSLDTWLVNNWSLDTNVDVSDYDSVDLATDYLIETLRDKNSKLDLLINCVGINKIDYLPNVTPQDFDLLMNTNAKSIYNTVHNLLPVLQGGTIINIVSNASHMPMTSSLAYNASKGAAAIMTKQLARELKKTHDITVFSISPNKMFGTGMSEYIDNRVPELRGWTPEQAKAYQLAGLPAGEETDPETVAEFIAFLVSSKQRHKYLNGCDIPYGA